MASYFNQFDWYWKVMDTNPSTQVYSSRVGAFIAISDATYVAWLAADGGNTPTTIDTFDPSLCGVLNQFARVNYVASARSFTVTANVTLTNPLPNFIDFTNNTGTAFKFILPAANSPVSIPVGVPVTLRNLSVGGGATACTIYLNDGTTLLTQVDPGASIVILLKLNSSYNGIWDVRPTGNVNVSGTPAANDVAQWVTSTTIKGVSLATWRTGAAFLGTTTFRSTAGGDGLNIVGAANQGQIVAAGASTDIGLVFSSKGASALTFYNASFARICAQFNSAPGSNTFLTFAGGVGNSTLGNNPTGNPIVMTSVIKLLGVTDGSSAGTGEVGEVLEVSTGTAVTVNNNTITNITSLVLPAGDWDVRSTVLFTGGAAAYTQANASLSLTSGALDNTLITAFHAISAPTNPVTLSPFRRVPISGSTTIYLTAIATGIAAPISCKGQIFARRMR